MPESLFSFNFLKKETLAQVFSCEFCDIFKNTFFKEHLWTTAFVIYLKSYQEKYRSSQWKCHVKKRNLWQNDLKGPFQIPPAFSARVLFLTNSINSVSWWRYGKKHRGKFSFNFSIFNKVTFTSSYFSVNHCDITARNSVTTTQFWMMQ